jgi:hypothetical protein
MTIPYNSVSSVRRLSSWLVVVLGLAAYFGLVYGLTMLPLQLEVPLPPWGTLVVPPVVYGLLVLLCVRRPSVLRWLVGTAVLSGLHVLLGLAREPLSALLDPALAGRPLPWMLPPPLPELVGVVLLLVPLRDALRARPRSARERVSGVGRSAMSLRSRAVVAPRLQHGALADNIGSLSEAVRPRSEPPPDPVGVVAPVAVAPPAPADEPRRRRTARAERRGAAEPPRPLRRSDVVLRIGLDRIMGQLPPGTFLAPEDEVAASLRDPGYLLIPGQLVVTQLAEGIARVAWSDIADQFPSELVGLGSAEISEHLGDGLKLPLDEVVSQLPHELFVADAPEIEIPGLERIPIPFHPVEQSGPPPTLLREAAPDIGPTATVERSRVEPVRVSAPPAIETPLAEPPAPAVVAPPEPPRVPETVRSAPEPVRKPEPQPAVASAPGLEIGEPMVRISFDRVASELPTEVFRTPLGEVAQQLQQPGLLLIPQSLILPQLGEGLIRVDWSVVAPQFPRDQVAVSDAEMMERLPKGIRLPLDEVIRQVPPDLFMAGGPAADVRGLESFPAPFQPLVSDPAPEPVLPPSTPAPAAPAEEKEVAPAAAVVTVAEPASLELPDLPVEPTRALAEVAEPEPTIEATPTAVAIRGEPEAETVEPALPPEPPAPASGPSPVTALAPGPGAGGWRDDAASAPTVVPAAVGLAESVEARRIVALLAPIASFEVSIQAMEGATMFAMASPTVAAETAVAVAGLTLPLLMDRRAPWPIDQITLRGPEMALVLTPLGGPGDRGSILAAATPRGGALALLEILSRRAAEDRDRRVAPGAADPVPGGRGLVPAAVPARAERLASSLTAFGAVATSVLRDADGEDVLYFFLPSGRDVPAVGAFAQDLQAVMRKTAGSGAVFRTAVLRSGNTLLVIQPEEVGHGRSIVVVAGGEVTRPGLAYRQVERAAATLVQA